MKFTTLLICLFSNVVLWSQNKVITSGNESPAVIAKDLSITYDVRHDAIEAIFWVYEQNDYDSNQRKVVTERILKTYSQSPEKKEMGLELSERTLQEIGITNSPELTNALEWDLFAQKYHLSTTGHKSPAIIANGAVKIWYGIPPKTLRALAFRLEKNKTDLISFEIKLADQVVKYEALKEELVFYRTKDSIYQKVEIFLDDGKLEEAEKLIDSDYYISKKRQAYKGFIFGKTKELVLKYQDAAIGYKDAINMDPENSKYHLAFGTISYLNADYDSAIKHFEATIKSDTLKNPKELMRIPSLYLGLSHSWQRKDNMNKAYSYFEKAVSSDTLEKKISDNKRALYLNTFGELLRKNKKYEEAQNAFENALKLILEPCEIDEQRLSEISKTNHRTFLSFEYEKQSYIVLSNDMRRIVSIGIVFNNLGLIKEHFTLYDEAIALQELSLFLKRIIFGNDHHYIAIALNNLGSAFHSKGDLNKAIEFYEEALAIDRQIFKTHPNLAIRLNNLAHAWKESGELEIATNFFEEAYKIDSSILGVTHQSSTKRLSKLIDILNESANSAKKELEFSKALNLYSKASFYLEIFNEAINQFSIQENKKFGVREFQKKTLDLNRRFDLKIQRNRLDCFKELSRIKEAEALAKKIWSECIKRADTRTLEDLKKEGYNFAN